MTLDTGDTQRGGGDGRDDVLAVLRLLPGSTIPELAHDTGLSEGNVWMALSALSRQGRVKRTGDGWKATSR